MIENLDIQYTTDIIQDLVDTIDQTFLDTLKISNPDYDSDKGDKPGNREFLNTYDGVNFIWGNLDDVNIKLSKNSSLFDNPSIILFLPNNMKEKRNYNPIDSLYLETSVKLYFLNLSNLTWDRATHYSRAINPTKQIWAQLVKNSRKLITLRDIENDDSLDLVNWSLLVAGVEEGKTYRKLILNGKFSGIEINLDLEIDKKYNKTNCN